MQRSVARRYVPLAALVVAQLMIIALAPSKAPDNPVGVNAFGSSAGASATRRGSV